MAGMVSGAPVNGCLARDAVPADRTIDGNMWCDFAPFESLDEVEDIISLVGNEPKR